MATYPAWNQLNPRQRAMAMARYRQRNGTPDTGGVPAGPVQPKAFSFADLYNVLAQGFSPIGKGPLGQRASIETQLQYGPQLQALMQLGQQSTQEMKSNIKGITRSGLAASQGIGQVAKDYVGLVGNGGTVPGATPPPSAEAAARLGLSRDAVSGILAQMQGQQLAGVSSGTARASQQYKQGRQDIISQMLQAAQKGALYNQGQYAGYVGDKKKSDEARTRFDAEQRNALIRAHINPDTGRYDPSLAAPPKPAAPHAPVDGVDYDTYMQMTPAQRRAAHKAYAASGRAPTKQKPSGPLLPNGEKPLTREAHNSLSQSIDYVRTHKSLFAGASRRDMVETLRDGISNKDAGIDKPGWYLEPVKNDLAIGVGLDLIQFGHVTGGTVRRLHSRGYSIKMLGVPTAVRPHNPYSGRT